MIRKFGTKLTTMTVLCTDSVYLVNINNLFFQIETLEEKRERGEVLDSDQQAKLLRKRDVVIQLEQVEAKKKTLGC